MRILLLSVLLSNGVAWAQNNFQYSVTVTELMSTADDNDGFGFSGPQDPVYNMWVTDEAANENTNCWIFEDDSNADYGVWTDITDYVLANVSGVNTTTITIDMAGFESDAAGATGCSPDSGDDAQYTRTTVATVDLTSLPEGTPNAMTVNLSSVYNAKIEITWTNLSASTLEIYNNMLVIAPNPNDGTFSLKSDEQLIGHEFAVYDISGRVVQSGIIGSSDFEITLTEPAGSYLLHIDGEYIIRKRITIK